MPVVIPDTLPATAALLAEGIQVIPNTVAVHQDIRPLRVALFNIMPTKQATELQWLRLLGNHLLQVEVTFVRTASYTSRHTSLRHLSQFYQTFDEIKDEYFDALIITGAPVGKLDFEEIKYWGELKEVMNWSLSHVYSTLFACWGAFAGLQYHYSIEKRLCPRKVCGVFSHQTTADLHPLLRAFDDHFLAPHSRYSEVLADDIATHPVLKLLAHSDEAGVYLIAREDSRQLFVLGHPEYDRLSLKGEYGRDLEKLKHQAPFPLHYFPNDNTSDQPSLTWRSHGQLLVSNWLNEIYQKVSYDHRSITPLVI
jgi:homoserine O-succinyltransferase/O-acetyltransferase